jgi:cobalt-zinc-cadmium resistance protein CzcA
VQEAQRKVAAAVPMPPGYRVVWGGEYEEYTASRAQLQFILPVTLALIFVILFALYNNFKFPFITVAAWSCRPRFGGLLALELRARRSRSRRASVSWRCSASRCRRRSSTSRT